MDTQRSTVQEGLNRFVPSLNRFWASFFFGFCFYRVFLSLQRQTLFYWVLPSFFFSPVLPLIDGALPSSTVFFYSTVFDFVFIELQWTELSFLNFVFIIIFQCFFKFILKSFFRRTWLGFWLAQFISWCFLLDFNVVLPSFT